MKLLTLQETADFLNVKLDFLIEKNENSVLQSYIETTLENKGEEGKYFGGVNVCRVTDLRAYVNVFFECDWNNTSGLCLQIYYQLITLEKYKYYFKVFEKIEDKIFIFYKEDSYKLTLYNDLHKAELILDDKLPFEAMLDSHQQFKLLLETIVNKIVDIKLIELAGNSNIKNSHRENFRKSGISDETIDNYYINGYLLSYIDAWQLYYPELLEDKKSDYYTKRYDQPIGGIKYRQPTGQSSRIFRPKDLNPEIMTNPDKPLIITEGEKKAIKAVQEGFICIAIPGVWNWRDKKQTETGIIPDMEKINWTNRIVYICFDNDIHDNANIQIALQGLASHFEGVGASKVIPVFLPQTGNKKMGIDDYLIEAGPKAFKLILGDALLKNKGKENKTVYTMPDEPSYDLKFPVDSIPEPFRSLVIQTYTRLNFPIEFVAASIIFSAASFIGKNTGIEINNAWTEKAIMYMSIVAPPTIQIKSPSLNIAYKYFLLPYHERLIEENKRIKKEYDKAIKYFKEAEKDKKNAGITIPIEPESPVYNYLIDSNFTVESLVKKQNQSTNGISLYCEELASFLKSFNQYKKSGNDLEYFLEGWDGKSYNKSRVGQDEDIYLKNVHHSIIGTIQNDTLYHLMFHESIDNGFSERWMFFLTETYNTGAISTQNIDNDLILECQNILWELPEKTKDIYYIDQDAIELFDQTSRYYVDYSKKDNIPKLLRSYLGKITKIILRMSLCLHCLKSPDVLNISIETMQESIQISTYLIECFKKILNYKFNLEAQTENEKFILHFLFVHDLNEITPKELHHIAKNRYKSVLEAAKELDDLTDKGLFKKEKFGIETKYIIITKS